VQKVVVYIIVDSRLLVERHDKMKKQALGNGTNQCLLCAEQFGLLAVFACQCVQCCKVSVAVSTLCRKETSASCRLELRQILTDFQTFALLESL